MKCPQCRSHLSITNLMFGSKQHVASGDVQSSRMMCPECSNRFYYCFSKFWLWVATFFALFGLSKIGHFQMNYQYALQSYIILSVCGIILPSVRLSASPGPLEQCGVSNLHRINFILYLLLCASAVVIATDIYTSIPPVKSSLVEIKGRVKEAAIRNGRFSFITLNSPRNIEFIVNDRFDSPAAHLTSGADVSLFVEKDPSITGDSYMVWEVRDGEAKVLLPYEDLWKTRSFEAIRTRSSYPLYFILLLLGYLSTRYLIDRKEVVKGRQCQYDNAPLLVPAVDSPSSNTRTDNTNYSVKMIFAGIALLSVVAFVMSIFSVFLVGIKVSAVVFVISVISLISMSVIKYTVSIFKYSKKLFAILLAGIVVAICLYQFDVFQRFNEYATKQPAITKSANTIFTAHLEGPLNSTNNVLYCASFQKAWNMLRDQMIRGEVRLADDPPAARLLNRQQLGTNDISSGSYVAGAGAFSQELVNRVNGELREKFGKLADDDFKMPQASADGRSIIAYAFLYKNLEFTTQFEKLTKPLLFRVNDHATPVMAFGIDKLSHAQRIHEKLASQVAILDYRDDNDFILSLISKSNDDEIILAKIKPGKTLLDTYQAVADRIAGGKRTEIWENDSLKIPKLDFDLSHNFPELEGKRLLNKGWEEWHIATAAQNIRFKLDENGAVLKSKAFMMAMKGETPAGSFTPRMFIFDKPFFICLKQKNGKYPYFALWVNNPELMHKKSKE